MHQRVFKGYINENIQKLTLKKDSKYSSLTITLTGISQINVVDEY